MLEAIQNGDRALSRVDVAKYLLIGLATAVAMVVLQQSPLFGIAGICMVFALLCIFHQPQWGILIAVFVIYTNVAVVAVQGHAPGADPTSANFGGQLVVLLVLAVLLALPVWQLGMQRSSLLFLPPLGWILFFLVSMVMSAVFARQVDVAAARISNFLIEGLLLFLLFTNLIQSFDALKKVLITLVLAAVFMAALTAIQQVTGTQNRTYGGLAQTGAVAQSSVGPQLQQPRAAGPIGEENRYAQILVVILPLTAFAYRESKKKWQRHLALASFVVILSGVALTYSRGGFLTALFVFAAMCAVGFIRIRHLVLGFAAFVVLSFVLLPYYSHRIGSMTSPFSQSAAEIDRSAALRLTENVACWNAFRDHPAFGVGPGQFGKFYSMQYGNQVGMLRQTRTYRGHNLYLEILAELGAVGLICFLGMILSLLRSLWQARVLAVPSDPERASLVNAVFLMLLTYLVSGVFLHLSYIRYFWLLIAIAAVTARLCKPFTLAHRRA